MNGPPALPSLEQIIIDVSLGILWAVGGMIAFIIFMIISWDKENRDK